MYSGVLKQWNPKPARTRPIDCGDRLRVHIRWMIRRDFAEVLEIERSSFDFPWLEKDFVEQLQNKNVIGMVAELDSDRVAGFMVYELHKTRMHLLNIAVAADVRRRGIARQMIDKLQGKLSSQRRTRISLEIRESNLGGQMFFSAVGFLAYDVVPDFWDDHPEDAYLMQFALGVPE